MIGGRKDSQSPHSMCFIMLPSSHNCTTHTQKIIGILGTFSLLSCLSVNGMNAFTRTFATQRTQRSILRAYCREFRPRSPVGFRPCRGGFKHGLQIGASVKDWISVSGRVTSPKSPLYGMTTRKSFEPPWGISLFRPYNWLPSPGEKSYPNYVGYRIIWIGQDVECCCE